MWRRPFPFSGRVNVSSAIVNKKHQLYHLALPDLDVVSPVEIRVSSHLVQSSYVPLVHLVQLFCSHIVEIRVRENRSEVICVVRHAKKD